jgi:chromate transporter
MTRARRTSVAELALLFLKLGTTAFGGPAAHIAMMEQEVVRRRGWLSREEFLDYLGATNLIPGPNSTELAIHIGRARAGWPGLLVAGTAFILPAAIIVAIIAWMYVRYGARPEAAALLYGIKPVVIAIVVQALWRLGATAVKTPALAAVALAAMAALVMGTHELVVLAGSGTAGALRALTRTTGRARAAVLAAAGSGASAHAAVGSAGTAALAAVGLWPLFLVFVKAGALLFGSGYVLLAFLRADLVQRLGWLTESQLLDAIAVGQVTPGPVFTTATFVGYVLGGPAGAVVATVGIFLPAFVFVAASSPVIPRLRQSARAGAILDGVNVGSLALMAFVSWHLARASLHDAFTLALACSALLALVRFRIDPTWLIVVGGVLGLTLR